MKDEDFILLMTKKTLLYMAAWTDKIIYKVAYISLKKQKGVSIL